MKTTYSTETKVAVALEFLKSKSVKSSDVAKKFNVSTRSVDRWKTNFIEEAKKVLEVNAKKSSRGFKPRNGRVLVVRSLLSTKGFLDKKTKDQYKECFDRCKVEGLSDLSYGLYVNLRATYLKLLDDNKL